MLKTTEGTAVFGTDTSTLREEIESCTDNQPLLIRFQFTTHLAPGNYFLNAGLRRDSVEGSVFMSRRVDAAVLRIVAGDSSSAAVGPADLNAQWAALPLSS
jgi:lipopolysaccharide transport system ATP-binding protein